WARLEAAQSRVAELEAQVASLQGQKAALGELAFHHSERQPRLEAVDATADDSGRERERGQRRGTPGHGRRQHPELPTVDVVLEPSDEDLHCVSCGARFVQITGEQVSEEIRRRVIYERVVTHRPRYVPSCDCSGNPAVRTASPPPKVIPKGELAPGILADLLVNKFDLSIPLERSLRLFAYEGLYLAKGSVTGMFQSMLPLFEPVYAAMREHLLLAGIWNVDETRWLVF
ncbi:transposase, partial [mine drainage metagenome]